MSRPATLSEAADRIRGGMKPAVTIPEFLDEFYRAPDATTRLGMMADEPLLTGDTRTDALLGAICEYLAK